MMLMIIFGGVLKLCLQYVVKGGGSERWYLVLLLLLSSGSRVVVVEYVGDVLMRLEMVYDLGQWVGVVMSADNVVIGQLGRDGCCARHWQSMLVVDEYGMLRC